MEWESVIGLEVHAQLLTESKIFCRCRNEYGAEPNSRVCPVCLGLPGVLPVLNEKAVEYTVRVGLAIGSKIARNSRFARKNYFYPDLPKGYQISQYEEPVCEGGSLTIETDGVQKKIGITRVHLEEDAGKSMHVEGGDVTKVDLNRCGVPLIEIVSEPDIRSPKEAHAYLEKLKQILLYLGVSDCNMEEGSLRCDANLSIRPVGTDEFGTKTELKNMNSFRGVEKALSAEIGRQKKLLESGNEVTQATMLWDEKTGELMLMRTKEEADDYRYFPEPDLVPVIVEGEYIEKIRDGLPELPDAKRKRFSDEYNLRDDQSMYLTSARETADYYEELASVSGDPKAAANWVMGELSRALNERGIEIPELRRTIPPERLSALMSAVGNGTISISAAKNVFEVMLDDPSEPGKLIEKLGLAQVSDSSEIDGIVRQVMEENPEEVERFRGGEDRLKGWFVGQVMAKSRGKANPKLANESLDRLLRE